VHWLRQGNFMRNAIKNLESPFLDEEISKNGRSEFFAGVSAWPSKSGCFKRIRTTLMWRDSSQVTN
jgi:hypothetical protein